MSFGRTLALARKAAGTQQRDLAALAGVSVSTLSAWERDITAPDANTLRTIADALRVSADVLLERRPFEWPERAPGLSSAPVAAPAPVASPAPAHAPAAAPRKAAPARRETQAATVAPVTPVTPAATVTTPAPAARPSPVSSALVNPFAGQASAVSIPAVSIPAASTSTPPAPAPPASTPLVRTIPAAAPRTAPVRPVAPVEGRPSSWAEAFAAEQIAAWGPGQRAAWNVSTGAAGVACPACGAAKRATCKCIERRRLWAAVRPLVAGRTIDPAQIESIVDAVVNVDLDAVSLAPSAPGGEWRVMIGDEAGPAVPRAEVDHAIWCGLVRLTQAQSGAPVWRFTGKGQSERGAAAEPDDAPDDAAAVDAPAAASEAPVDTGAEDAPPVARRATVDAAAVAAAFLAKLAAAPESSAPASAPYPTRRNDLPPPAAHEVIEVPASTAEDEDDEDEDY